MLTVGRENGFTLLEVMIALAIIGIALVTLIGLETRTVQLAERQQRVTQATLLAQGKMTEIEVGSQSLTGLSGNEGLFEPPFELYRWSLVREATPLPGIEMVTVSVVWGKENRNEQVDLTSFMPTQAGVL
ncbi:MAG: prepilin-type N-terminal cleavage/methylation domain-containing protein [Desulfuromonadales bacterium]|nr:prepilin-type N-terminal cleavage/methylation domain-containing protein [Desulfuromonadales bacterium]